MSRIIVNMDKNKTADIEYEKMGRKFNWLSEESSFEVGRGENAVNVRYCH